jgi:hypothetical protein
MLKMPLRKEPAGIQRDDHSESTLDRSMSRPRLKGITTICALILAVSSFGKAMTLQVRQGRPIVDGVYVNGHGPYSFLLDTGSNVNLIQTDLAHSIGLKATYKTELSSAVGTRSVAGIEGIEITLGSLKSDGQMMLFSNLEEIHHLSSSVRGVLGQHFLSQFDYLLDLRSKRLEFGKLDIKGTRMPFQWINARPAISTSLGLLILDSGATRVVLFGIEAHIKTHNMRTISGSQDISIINSKPLRLEGRTIWQGEALAILHREEAGVAGLLPVSLFKAIYVCNSERYVVLN